MSNGLCCRHGKESGKPVLSARSYQRGLVKNGLVTSPFRRLSRIREADYSNLFVFGLRKELKDELGKAQVC